MNIKKKTALAGRKYRGRCYFAGAPYNAIDAGNGRWKVAHVTLMNDIALEMITYVGLDDFGPHLYPVILHRADFTDTRIITAIADEIPRSQRRREIGIGI